MSAVAKEVERLAAAIDKLEKSIGARPAGAPQGSDEQRKAIYAEIARSAKPVEERVDKAIDQLEMLLGDRQAG